MTPEIQALRERFRDQMPGMAEFDELLAKYERLLQAQTALEQRWLTSAPALVKELRSVMLDIANSEDLGPVLRQRILDAIKGGKP